MASQKAYDAYGAFISRLCIYIILQNLKLLTRQLVILYFMGNILKKGFKCLVHYFGSSDQEIKALYGYFDGIIGNQLLCSC